MKNKFKFQNSTNFLIYVSVLWAIVLMMIGAWWIYLIFNVETILEKSSKFKLHKMILWEGGSFVFFLLLLSASIIFLYLKDQKKSKMLQIFFSSLTHELKTPLASIRLQTEVLLEILNQNNNKNITTISNRLISDTEKLEVQLNKILQLSSTERGIKLHLENLGLIPTVKMLANTIAPPLNIIFENDQIKADVSVNEMALEIIVRNLIENTKNHTVSKNITLKFFEKKNKVGFIYKDEGEFNGDTKKLGEIFYRHNSIKGSGIGLYLIRKLMSQMKGNFFIENKNKLQFILEFNKIGESDA